MIEAKLLNRTLTPHARVAALVQAVEERRRLAELGIRQPSTTSDDEA